MKNNLKQKKLEYKNHKKVCRPLITIHGFLLQYDRLTILKNALGLPIRPCKISNWYIELCVLKTGGYAQILKGPKH